MSKARLVITAVVVEGRGQSEVAREYGVSQGWISRLVARYRLESEGAFEPRSRRPLTSPTRLPRPTIELIVTLRNDLLSKGLDHGPHTKKCLQGDRRVLPTCDIDRHVYEMLFA